MSEHLSKQTKTAEKRRIDVRPIKRAASVTLANDGETGHEHGQAEIEQAQNELERLKTSQKELTEQTNAEIEEARTAWEEEKQVYIDEARQEGYTDGFNQGMQHGQEQYQQLISDANDAVEAATHNYYKILDESDEQLLDLAVHIAEKIMHQTLNERPEALMPLVTSAIQSVKDKSDVTLYLNPSDYTFVDRHQDDLNSLTGNNTVLSVYADETLSQGSCLIDHPLGHIDASIDTQLQGLRQTLQAISMENDL